MLFLCVTYDKRAQHPIRLLNKRVLLFWLFFKRCAVRIGYLVDLATVLCDTEDAFQDNHALLASHMLHVDCKSQGLQFIMHHDTSATCDVKVQSVIVLLLLLLRKHFLSSHKKYGTLDCPPQTVRRTTNPVSVQDPPAAIGEQRRICAVLQRN